MESHSIEERAFIFHLKERKSWRDRRGRDRKRVERGKRGTDRQRQREGFSLRGLVSQPPFPQELGKAPALSNLILHISEAVLLGPSLGR